MRSRVVSNRYFEVVPAAFLLIVLAAELGFSVRRQSQTIDEADHIYAGYRYWQCGDFGVNPVTKTGDRRDDYLHIHGS